MGEDSKQVTAVTIHHHTYQVRSDGDPEYVKQLAQFVDDKMMEVVKNTSAVDSLKVAVLAALNIADDYFSAQREIDSVERAVAERSERIITLLDSIVASE